MLAGGSVHVTAAATPTTDLRAGELEAVRRRLSRLERQTEQIAEAPSKCCVRVMANCPPAQFHSNIQAMLELMDDNMGDFVSFTRTEATAVVIHPRHTTQMGEMRTALQQVIDEFNGQQRLLQLPEVWQVLQQSITKKFLGIAPKLCYEAWRQTVLALSGQPLPYIRTKYPQDNQRTAFALLLEDVVLTSGYIDTDGAVVKLEIKDKAVINGVGVNGRQIQEALRASWRCDYMMDAVLVTGNILTRSTMSRRGRAPRKEEARVPEGPRVLPATSRRASRDSSATRARARVGRRARAKDVTSKDKGSTNNNRSSSSCPSRRCRGSRPRTGWGGSGRQLAEGAA